MASSNSSMSNSDEFESVGPDTRFTTLDRISASNSTNPFLDTFQLPAPPSPSDDSDLADVLRNLNTTLSRNSHSIKDIRHIDNFSGDGNNSINVIKLKNFLLDLQEYFEGRDLSESDKLIIAKQKISGPAKLLVGSTRPINFTHLKDVLNSSFGTVQADYETLIKELKQCKINGNEAFQNYYVRVEERAKVLTYKLQCGFENKAVFEPFAKTVLSNFPVHIASQNEILRAISCCDALELYKRLDNILQFNPDILIRNNSISSNKKQVNSVTCANCYQRGHVVKDCNAMKHYNPFFRASE